jgi:AraC-like DNA-binding protein
MGIIQKGGGFENERYFIIPDEFLAKFAENPLARFLTVTDIGHFPNAQYHYCTRPEGTEQAIVIYCDAGSGYVAFAGGEKRQVKAGELFIIPPGMPHEYAASDDNPWSIFWIHLRGEYFDTFYESFSPRGIMPVSESAAERIRALFYRCFDMLEMPYQWEEFLYLCQLGASILSLIPQAVKRGAYKVAPSGSRAVERAVEYMKAHLHERISLEDIARAGQYSPSYIHNLFHKTLGYSPVEYFLRMKMQAAAKDIFFSGKSIRTIAEYYGIPDPYYFSRLFKRVMGMPPTRYRTRTSHFGYRTPSH